MADFRTKSGRTRLADSVIVGHDEILFHRDHEAVEQVSGQLPFTPAELSVWTRTLEARAQWCSERGIVFRFLIVPEKHVVYADKLPGIVISANRPALQLLAALSPNTRSQCLYPIETLTEQRRYFPTYFQTDTHWTQQGAFQVYLELMTSLQQEVPFEAIPSAMPQLNERKHVGDLGVRLEPEREELTNDVVHTGHWPFRRILDNHGRSRGSTVIFESDRVEAPRFLAFRDSFLNYIIPHVIPIFSKSVFVSSISMHTDAVEAFKPKIMLFEIAERFLGYLEKINKTRRPLPEDGANPSFEVFSGISLKQKEWV